MSIFVKHKNNYYKDYTNYSGLLTIYLLTCCVAATVIIPDQEYWYYGVLKALVWPLYTLTKVIG